ncbi:hypothetical protein ACFL1A_03485 [Patescibacteria group bacterium]
MKSEEMLAKLLETSYTKDEVLRRLGIIKKYLEQKLYKSEELNLETFLEDEKVIDADKEMLLKTSDEIIKSLNKDNMYKVLDDVKKKVGELETVKIYLPYESDTKENMNLGKWFRDHVGKTSLLDIKKDSSLVGGCAVATKGKWQDYSLRYFIRKEKNEIVNSLEKYDNKIES